MKRRKFFRIFGVVLVCAAILLTASASEGMDMQEGEWEHTAEMVMEGMPSLMPPTKTHGCLTKKDLVPEGKKDKDCMVKDQKMSGNTVRWTVICKDKDGTSEGKGVITYSGSSYKGTIKMTVTDKKGSTESMTMKMSGKYLGPCTKETIAAKKERERQVSEAKKKGEQAHKQADKMMAKQQQTQKDERRNAEALIAKVKVPKEDKNACVFKECERAMGELNLKEGIWKIEKQSASKTKDSIGQNIFSLGKSESTESRLSPEVPLGIRIGECTGKETVIKRSGNKLTWNYKCDYSQGDLKNTKAVKGGITFNGNSFDGGAIETSYAKTNGMETTTTTYTKLSGTVLKGRAYTSQKRSYTSSGRETASDKVKEGIDNPVKSIKKIFNW